MANDDTSDLTTEQVIPNPTGRGGFGDNPQNRNPGGWKKEMVFSYQYRRFMNMTTAELKEYSSKPDTERTVVEDLAYSRVIAAKKSLPDVKEITDRTEGKAPQTIGIVAGDPVEAVLNKLGMGDSYAGETQETTDATS